MSELQAEIVIRLMSDGKVMFKYTPMGPLFLYGMLDMTKDGIRAEYLKKQMDGRIVEANTPRPRILPGDIPPMGNGGGK